MDLQGPSRTTEFQRVRTAPDFLEGKNVGKKLQSTCDVSRSRYDEIDISCRNPHWRQKPFPGAPLGFKSLGSYSSGRKGRNIHSTKLTTANRSYNLIKTPYLFFWLIFGLLKAVSFVFFIKALTISDTWQDLGLRKMLKNGWKNAWGWAVANDMLTLPASLSSPLLSSSPKWHLCLTEVDHGVGAGHEGVFCLHFHSYHYWNRNNKFSFAPPVKNAVLGTFLSLFYPWLTFYQSLLFPIKSSDKPFNFVTSFIFIFILRIIWTSDALILFTEK